MIGLKKIFTGKGKKQTDKRKAAKAKVIPIVKVAEVIRHFEIGQRVSFFPEYKEELTLDTIVVGYMINDYTIHSAAEISIETHDDGLHLIITAKGERFDLSEVTKFAVLVPAESHEEDKLDFNSKLELHRIGLFRTGNSITLVSQTHAHLTPSIESQANRTQELHEGIYAGLKVAILNVLVNTLELKERRKHQRVSTHIPVTLHALNSDKRYRCTLLDFSESGARLGIDIDSKISVITQIGRTLVLEVPLPEFEQFYVLQGSIQKLSNNSLVMQLDKIVKNGALRPLGMIDALGIKGILLNHPNSTMAE